MLDDITQAFSSLVGQLSWMDHKAKKGTLAKAAAIRRYVGYPEWLLKEGELEKQYVNVSTIISFAFLILRVKICYIYFILTVNICEECVTTTIPI